MTYVIQVGNMYGAGDYLINVWGFDRHEVKPVVLEYINHGLREEREADLLSYGRDRPTANLDHEEEELE
jgi:hypothetical protein